MAIVRTDLSSLQALVVELDQIQHALLILASGAASIRVELTAPSFAGVILALPVPVDHLTGLLTARQAQINSLLANAGVI